MFQRGVRPGLRFSPAGGGSRYAKPGLLEPRRGRAKRLRSLFHRGLDLQGAGCAGRSAADREGGEDVTVIRDCGQFRIRPHQVCGGIQIADNEDARQQRA